MNAHNNAFCRDHAVSTFRADRKNLTYEQRATVEAGIGVSVSVVKLTSISIYANYDVATPHDEGPVSNLEMHMTAQDYAAAILAHPLSSDIELVFTMTCEDAAVALTSGAIYDKYGHEIQQLVLWAIGEHTSLYYNCPVTKESVQDAKNRAAECELIDADCSYGVSQCGPSLMTEVY